MTRWFTSDIHIAHPLVAGLRGFHQLDQDGVKVVDTQAHDAKLAENWDRVVRKDDIVFLLGDIAMNPNKGAFEWLLARPGHIQLISGNHDATHPMHSKALPAQRKWLAEGYVETISAFLQIKVGGRNVVLSHFPYRGEGNRDMEDRHTEWRLRDEGIPLLHGHTHADNIESDAHSYHVGLDGHGLELVHEDEIVEWLSRQA